MAKVVVAAADAVAAVVVDVAGVDTDLMARSDVPDF
mgnify:CR=1 FL=1